MLTGESRRGGSPTDRTVNQIEALKRTMTARQLDTEDLMPRGGKFPQLKAQKPKILVISKFYPPERGGIEKNAKQTADALADIYPVRVIGFSKTKAVFDISDNLTVSLYPAKLQISRQPVSLQSVMAVIFTKCDVIHFHAPNPLLSAPLLLKISLSRRTKLVITHHMDMAVGSWLRPIARGLYRSLQRRAEAVIVTSAKNVRSSDEIDERSNIVVIPLGLDWSNYLLTPAEIVTSAELRATRFGTKPLLCFIGRLVRYKGLDILLMALAELKNVNLVIIGDGPLLTELTQLSSKLGLNERVTFAGELSEGEKRLHLAASDIFVFPSTEKTEAFGIAQLEANCLRIPVVATNLPTGVTDVSIDGETAVLADPSDPVDLARAIQCILDNPSLKESITETAFVRLTEKFSEALSVQSTVDLFRSICLERQ